MKVSEVGPLEGDTYTITPQAGGVHFAGVIALRNPSNSIGEYLRKLHDAALSERCDSVTLDLARLEFMNSSAIRMFIDWIEWIKADARGYQLRFVINSQITWQRSTFGALKSIGGDVVKVDASGSPRQ